MFIGLGVLLVGIIFLLQNLGYIGGNVWQIIWPAIIIIAGLLIVFKPKFRSGIFDGKNKK
ncbi:hypothetical protein COT12_01700 [Candidatus Berkelbacteria bacterium CG08_land_8_20_14_0_20_39_8]|uniref:LiaI-LiaF-like transmembrane region domain-containing protein n=1 Tax=Candidatus Berkelbacteria bacterium CG08_land_8_20_14_0_20_39_8 TaxID=1974511 RepID=A0A2M6YC92_9BACT|nr:MAG: hypothetical protein COT12_01700 [Candidatus Berkelbacteria bacterium CG08_land_8_20_14_0_20_39_8]